VRRPLHDLLTPSVSVTYIISASDSNPEPEAPVQDDMQGETIHGVAARAAAAANRAAAAAERAAAAARSAAAAASEAASAASIRQAETALVQAEVAATAAELEASESERAAATAGIVAGVIGASVVLTGAGHTEHDMARDYGAGRVEAKPAHATAGDDSTVSAANTPARGGSSAEMCGICLDHLEAGQEARLLRCMHSFHAACSAQWLAINRKCPICQRDIFDGPSTAQQQAMEQTAAAIHQANAQPHAPPAMSTTRTTSV